MWAWAFWGFFVFVLLRKQKFHLQIFTFETRGEKVRVCHKAYKTCNCQQKKKKIRLFSLNRKLQSTRKLIVFDERFRSNLAKQQTKNKQIEIQRIKSLL